MSATPNEVGHHELLDARGKPVFLRELWNQRPAVLGFVRHFGCLLCHEAVAALRDVKDEIQRRGARLSIIGNGNPYHAQAFAERMNLVGSVYTDPSRAAYRAFGMKHGITTTFGPQSWTHGIRALRAGHRQQRTMGDPWQQGGTLIVSPNGELVWSYLSRTAGDHAPTSVVLSKLDGIGRA